MSKKKTEAELLKIIAEQKEEIKTMKRCFNLLASIATEQSKQA